MLTMPDKNIKSICILGGGTAGWMAASLLSSALQGSRIKITVVESPNIASIGVGESTVPSIMDFLRVCQINLKDFVEATSATFKLGIRFDDWLKPGASFFHPFGAVGQNIHGFDFYQAWLKTVIDGNATRWVDHSPCAVMAEQQRFIVKPAQHQNWVLRSFAHALHLDAVLAARYLRSLSVGRGVERIEATVTRVVVDDHQFIRSLELDNGNRIASDFYIDCSGFNGLLIEKSLGVGYEDWTAYLPCDRAVAAQTSNTKEPPPFTLATAQAAGWSWKIPLQHRTGNGYVFSSQYCSDDEAVARLKNIVDGDLLTEPRIIPFTTGRRLKIWHNNCLALGLASGFIEPLESTAIHLVYKTLVHFIKYFPDLEFDSHTERAFNQKINNDYQEVRDFVILHYCTTQRDDTEFWRWCRNMSMPDSLREKVREFRERGQLEAIPGQLFTGDSWCSILEGMQLRPKKYHPLMDAFNNQELARIVQESAQQVLHTVKQMPRHADFIRQHCVSKQSI